MEVRHEAHGKGYPGSGPAPAGAAASEIGACASHQRRRRVLFRLSGLLGLSRSLYYPPPAYPYYDPYYYAPAYGYPAAPTTYVEQGAPAGARTAAGAVVVLLCARPRPTTRTSGNAPAAGSALRPPRRAAVDGAARGRSANCAAAVLLLAGACATPPTEPGVLALPGTGKSLDAVQRRRPASAGSARAAPPRAPRAAPGPSSSGAMTTPTYSACT